MEQSARKKKDSARSNAKKRRAEVHSEPSQLLNLQLFFSNSAIAGSSGAI